MVVRTNLDPGSVEKEDYASYIIDIREYDVIYYQRVSIDSGKLLKAHFAIDEY
jgi:hypothetical protein